MRKISLVDAQKTTTMFMLDSEIEGYYSNIISRRVKDLQNNLLGIGTKEGLSEFILKNDNSIEELITLLGLKQEKFKRVVSWIRLSQGFVFDSEWDSKRVQRECANSPIFLDLICELFQNGRINKNLQSIIPAFILDDFFIDKNVMGRLANEDILTSLVKDKYSTEYNSKYCEHYYKLLDSHINSISRYHSAVYRKNQTVDDINIIANTIEKGNKTIIINSNFYLTTSSSQSRYATQIDNIYSSSYGFSNLLVINILDGAGWIGRPSDFKTIHANCAYFLNLKNIDLLNDIIEEFFNE